MRAAILFSVSVVSLGACASSNPAPIDYRSLGAAGDPSRAAVSPKLVQVVTATAVPAAPAAPAARAPISIPKAAVIAPERTSSPAVAEARDMAPEMSPRPGGSMKQPVDNISQRRVQVEAGDSVYEISRRFSVNMRALIETNRLEPPYTLNPGQVVMLPPPNLHVVEQGETLYSVSRRYNIDTRSLALMNGLEKPWTVWPGDELLLPALARDEGRRAEAISASIATQPSPSFGATPVVATPPTQIISTQPKPALSVPPPSSSIASRAPAAPAPLAAAPVVATVPKSTGPAGPISLTPKAQVVAPTSGLFVWPVQGRVLAGFGVGADGIRNDGVNIAAAPGTQVKSAAAGDVVYAGNELSGFGNLLLIRHADGWVSAYAHADRLLVKEGERVAQGQPVAEAGANGGKLHFELRKGKDPVDPTQHLPKAG